MWTKITDSLPADGQRVFVAMCGVAEPVQATYSRVCNRWFMAMFHGFDDDVTHWMPMLTMPTAEERAEVRQKHLTTAASVNG